MLGRVVATRRAWTGVAVGLSGVTLLTLGGSRGGVDPVGAAVLLVASMAWSLGTLYFTGGRKPASQPYAAGIPLLGGGVLLLIASALFGEPGRLSIGEVPTQAVLALAYLIVFGSVVAFTAYSWLVEQEGPSRALSFTYVNPLVAVLLGSLFLHEPLTWRIALAAAAIVAAVVLIIGGTAAPAKPPHRREAEGAADGPSSHADPRVPPSAPARRRSLRSARAR
jgi:drug/metabolite transporter (DMT)-like permease